ncbi:very-long-chain (3R)-3-hydroxyacyl-CoA dehydratase 3-like [Mercenaria mercenaria]|uniref:very-long-chain (3R)-3-hydroxyacyl-CoA dehydratase 3-like n=1 Tax=Mercenaria mercenaria TaxID=6596 RepID=UPI00234F75C1|nr:very-long-chain (3R)-3-hydroxyacyl-CoA dehydratase 3-like [Mercenaria mercenaria]
MAGTLRPFVFWGQKNDSISLKIDLRDVTIDNVNLTEDRLETSFEGVGAQGHNKYSFELDFYLPVDTENSKVRTTDRAVEFSIKKKGAEVWPRLTEKQEKLPWLKIDFDKFAFEDDDDSEEDAEKMAAEEIMRKLEKDLKENSVKSIDMKATYLFTYNFLQFVGFLYIVTVLSYNFLKLGSVAKEKAFEMVGYQIMFCQTAAVLEVIHPLLGLVKTGALAPLLQVGGRNLILFLLVLQDVRLQIAPVVWYLLMTWSTVELIRYPFYMFSSIGMDVKMITWLRYTAWIPLYPLGILFEGTIVIMSIPLFEESGKFSLQLPNSANFAFYFPWFLHLYLLILGLGGIQMMKHMHSLRKKKFGSKDSQKKAA